MSFEDTMMKRLAKCHAEACNTILEFVKSGLPLSDAVSDTIRTLPASKTRELRRWLEEWEAWEEWLSFKEAGWKIKPGQYNKSIVYVTPPRGTTADKKARPSERAVAAGADVRSVTEIGSNVEASFANGRLNEVLTQVTYQVTS